MVHDWHMKEYSYVGPSAIARRAASAAHGHCVVCALDLVEWLCQPEQELDETGAVVATFVIDNQGRMRLAHRRSEHVVCAGGEKVRSAGEIAFVLQDEEIHVSWATNQSTGYCPEPESWAAVRDALDRVGIDAPDGFTTEFNFRRCSRCRSINVVKDGDYECAVCCQPLPLQWNMDKS
jgi:hypothetical protein